MTTPWHMVMNVAKEHQLDDEHFQTQMEDMASTFQNLPTMMTPRIVDEIEQDGVYSFTLEQCDVSWANALRRILLTHVPICCIRTENESVNQCRILENTSRLHNEILKHRLSCIPIHTTNLEQLPGIYELVLDITNDSDHVLIVTSEQFRIRHKKTHAFLDDVSTRSLFPPHSLTGDFIEFARLRPKLGDIPPEHIHLVADFSVATPHDNSMFNSLSTCTYSATNDTQAALHALQALIPTHSPQYNFHKHNFLALDAQRFTIKHSWHFQLQSIGVFSNTQLLSFALSHLQHIFLQSFHFFTHYTPLPHSHTLHDYHLSLPYDLSFAQSFNHVLQHLFVPTHIPFSSFLQTHPLLSHITLRISPNNHNKLLLPFASLYALHLCGGLRPPSYTPPSEAK